VQTAKLDGETGVMATVAGKDVRRSMEIETILNAVHEALEGNGEGEGVQQELRESGQEDLRKDDERREQGEALGTS
jgi:hypothetical protein